MCAQLVCEVPDECTVNDNANCCGDVAQPCATYCPPTCDPCYVPPEFPPCPPNNCNCRCDCGDTMGCCYQQPPRAQPIRPMVSLMRSSAPMETETIYKRSYYANCGDCFRAQPIRPCNNLSRDSAPMEKCTVQKLSYMPPCCPRRTAAIRPIDNGLRFNGPLYAMTSQKHDFVPKGYSRRDPIRPVNGIWKACDPMERCTINKLSYLPVDVCHNPPPKPFIQGANCILPTGPSERCTVQKLSYLPVCLPAKEHMPWAEKVRCIPPPFENLCTTYNLSYMPNCCAGRTAPVMPISGLKYLGTDASDGNTVYKLSYMPVDARCCRPQPIRPINGLCMPTGPMDNCTVQKLSYQPTCCAPRTQPIKPKENRIQPCGPVHFMTTQKHDFVPKPCSRRNPIRAPGMICRPTGPLERCTINKLSYMPVNVCEYRRPCPVLPRPGVCLSEGPIEKCTTYKLSYLPNCIQPKPDMPWAHVSSYQKPTAPIEKCTIQKLSYGPPGTFNRCGGCCPTNNCPTGYPKAGICN